MLKERQGGMGERDYGRGLKEFEFYSQFSEKPSRVVKMLRFTLLEDYSGYCVENGLKGG